MSELIRFTKAQASTSSGFEVALAEMKAGHKQKHWIWYIFPQLAGLGSSSMARAYAIKSLAEAADYLRDETLRARLLSISRVVALQLRNKIPLKTLMGWSIDAQKLVSSLTLFGETAKRLFFAEKLEDCRRLAVLTEEILDVADAQGFPRCAFTLAQFNK